MNDQTMQLVDRFHERFNAGDTAGMLEMTTDTVSVGGARGRGNGRDLLREWLDRKTTSLTPQRWFRKDDLVVVEELVEWRTGRTDAVTDRTVWGMVFAFEGGKIARIGRYANIGEAVTTFGMFETDEVEH